MPDPETRTCVRLNCSRRGEPTTDERCPECDFPTRAWSEFRPDPTQTQLDQENDDALDAGAALSSIGVQDPMLVVTTASIPGATVRQAVGDVIGTATWSWGQSSLYARSQASDPEVLKVHARARERMIREARRLRADAIIGMRFNSGAVGNQHTVVAYGTAVRLAAGSQETIRPS